MLPDEGTKEDSGLPKFAVVGRPNVGKSTLINTLVGNERNIVMDIAGTTRDSVHTHFNLYGFDFELIDTAGLRRKKQIEDQLEFYSTVRTIRSIEQSDVCLLLIDAQNGMERQDQAIFWQVVNSYRGVDLRTSGTLREGPPNYETFDCDSGAHCAVWMCRFCLPPT